MSVMLNFISLVVLPDLWFHCLSSERADSCFPQQNYQTMLFTSMQALNIQQFPLWKSIHYFKYHAGIHGGVEFQIEMYH